MTVEAEGIYYHNVVSITQISPNKAVLVMCDGAGGEKAEKEGRNSAVIPIFAPIQVIGHG